jgi:hypothetical protein
VSKAAVGAVFNVHGAILEVILGVPPLQTLGRIISIKHYLKVLHDSNDIHYDFVKTQLNEKNPTVLCHLREVQKFLQWKAEHFNTEVQACDLGEISHRNLDHILLLSPKTYKYTKGMIQQFTELLWQESLQNLLLMEGWSDIPRVSCNPLPIPFGVSREVEVLVMSLMYKNNLLNSFLFRVDRAAASPLCICGSDEQTALHLLSSCELVDTNLQCQAERIITLCNSGRPIVDLATEQGSIILNCSRDDIFISVCVKIVESEGLNLKRKINLSKR